MRGCGEGRSGWSEVGVVGILFVEGGGGGVGGLCVSVCLNVILH